MKKALTNNLVLILGAIFTIVGAIVIAAGVVSNISSRKFMENAVSANAIIEEIEVDEHGDETDHDVFVTYEYDGYIYKFKSDILNFNPNDFYNIGNPVDVYVEQGNFKNYYVDVIDKSEGLVRDYT